MSDDLPLQGIRVLELGQFLSAPRCGRILAEEGAEVVKVEPPSGEPMRLLMTLSGAERVLAVVNAGKKGITVNLKQEAGRALLGELAEQADVLIENQAPGALEKLGLGYADLARRNARLVYASISGFGHTGPWGERTAFDIIAQATGGIMEATGRPDRPPAVFFADLVSGAYAAAAIGFALLARGRTGRGRHIDLSMQDVMYAHNFRAHTDRALGEAAEQVKRILGRSIDHLMSDPDRPLPFWSSYRARDGFVAVVALTDGQWKSLMEAIGQHELAADPRFASFIGRVQNASAGLEVVSRFVEAHTVQEVVERLAAHRVPCGAVAGTEAVNQDPQLEARGMLGLARSAAGPPIGIPGPTLHRAPADEEGPPHPRLGEHTEAVLREWLSLSAEKIASLRGSGAL